MAALLNHMYHRPIMPTAQHTPKFTPNTAQQRFDALYISSTEVMQRMGVSRPSILRARERGLLPDPVVVNDGTIYLWERNGIEHYLAAWKTILDVRRNHNEQEAV